MRRRGVIAKCVREQVSDKDLVRLRPGQWLNDEIINFYGQLIMSRSEAARGDKENKGKEVAGKGGRKAPLNAHYFSTFFWTKLKDAGYEKGRLSKWTKKVRPGMLDTVRSLLNSMRCSSISSRKTSS